MTINYKNKFYIYHPDGKFTEEQLIKILDAAYNMGKKDGYNDGYEQGKKNNFSITYPWWNQPYYDTPTWDWTKITCNSTSRDAVIPTVTTTAPNNPPSITTATTTNNICREFKYNGTER